MRLYYNCNISNFVAACLILGIKRSCLPASVPTFLLFPFLNPVALSVSSLAALSRFFAVLSHAFATLFLGNPSFCKFYVKPRSVHPLQHAD